MNNNPTVGDILLGLFYEKFGYLANLDTIFHQGIELVADRLGWDVSWEKNQIVFTQGDNSVIAPRMTPKGYFVINGIDKVPLIQELRNRHAIFITLQDEDPNHDTKGFREVLVQTKFPNGSFPIRLHVSSSDIYLDVSAFSAQLHEAVGEPEPTMFGGKINRNKIMMRVTLERFFSLFDVNLHEVILGMQDPTISLMIMSSIKPHEGNTIEVTKDILKKYLFGISYLEEEMDSFTDKVIVNTLLYMVKEGVDTYFNKRPVTDRDDLSHKIFRSSGILIGNTLGKILKKSGDYSYWTDELLLSMMRTGNMLVNGRNYPKMVVQVSHRSTIDTIASVRKIVIPCDENSAGRKMRQVHPSQVGFICLSETPEGKSTGLVKHLAFTSVISPVLDEKEIFKYLTEIVEITYSFLPPISLPTISSSPETSSSETSSEIFEETVPILLDGICLGRIKKKDCPIVRHKLKTKFIYVSISRLNKSCLEIRTWVGRLMRPLIVREKEHLISRYLTKYKHLKEDKLWDRLIKRGYLEYIDASERTDTETGSLPLDEDKDRVYREVACSDNIHREIHPMCILGMSASLIPFANHNQTARNIFASSMVKQAIQFHPNPPFSHEGKYLVYGQQPLVKTTGAKLLELEQNPNGINLLVMIMSFSGYNMEDAIIINQGAVERGIFASRVRKTKLDEKDIKLDPYPRVVDEYGREGDEYRYLSVGDKLTSRHAQKGVIGRIFPEEDMPFTEDGCRPDILFNAHGIPSRMTMGQLLEGVIGASCVIRGEFYDGTPFGERLSIENILKMEKENETFLYDGITGKLIEKVHSMNIVYYMALKHQSVDKVYVRWIGPTEVFSRQPVSGKRHGGGLKLGEMEVDALISHGASQILMDSIRQSDMKSIPVCDKCGEFPISSKKCHKCQSKKIISVDIPYSLKVFSDFAKCGNVGISLKQDK